MSDVCPGWTEVHGWRPAHVFTEANDARTILTLTTTPQGEEGVKLGRAAVVELRDELNRFLARAPQEPA